MKTTNKSIIVEQLRKHGYVDNFWCIDRRITTRLGAVIFVLKEEGWKFDEVRSGFITGTKNFRYWLTSAPAEKKQHPDFVPGVGVLKTFAGDEQPQKPFVFPQR